MTIVLITFREIRKKKWRKAWSYLFNSLCNKEQKLCMRRWKLIFIGSSELSPKVKQLIYIYIFFFCSIWFHTSSSMFRERSNDLDFKTSKKKKREKRYSIHLRTSEAGEKRYVEWRCRASIPVPLACKASALPSELHPRACFQWNLTWLDSW